MGPTMLRPLLTLLAFLSVGVAEAADRVLVISDLRGQHQPCGDCPDAVAKGGLARLARLVEERRASQATLVLDAGNALYGEESGTGGASRILASYSTLGLDALSVSYRDFRNGKGETLATLAEAAFPVISANLFHADRGERLFAPCAFLEVQGETIAVVGLTERPAALEYLPHLREQLDGIDVREPVAALVAQLDELEGQVDHIWVLYYGSALGVRVLRESAAGRAELLFAPGLAPAAYDASFAPRLVPVASQPFVTEVTFGTTDGARAFELGRVELDASFAIASDAGEHRDEPTVQPAVLPLRAGQNGLRVAVHGQRVETRNGVRTLVLDLELENRVPIAAVISGELPEGLVFKDLTTRICLVADGWRVIRPLLGSEEDDLPGRLVLPRIGARRRGTLAFPLTGPEPQELELLVYHEACPPVSLPLRGEGAGLPARAALATGSNEVIDLAVHGFELVPPGPELQAPPGSMLAIVEVRGRSRLTNTVPARALDSSAEEGDEVQVGLTFEVPHVRRSLRMRVDGRYVYSMLDAEPVSLFLPDRATGATLTFLVPAEHQSLTLELALPELVYSHLMHPLRPEPVQLALQEGGGPGAPQPILAVLEEAPLRTAVRGWRLDSVFAGHPATTDEQFLVLEVSLTNLGQDGGLYVLGDRYQLLVEGRLLGLDALTYAGLRRPMRELWMAAREERAFELVFSIPLGTKTAQLDYSGTEQATTVSILVGDDSIVLEPAGSQPEDAAPPRGRGGESGCLTGGASSDHEAAPSDQAGNTRTRLALAPPAQEAIDAAIARGREFLWEQIHKDGQKLGYYSGDRHVIAALALQHAGAFDDFPAREAELATFLADFTPYNKVYRLATLAMLIDAGGRTSAFPTLEGIARRLTEGLSMDGLFGYGAPKDPGSESALLPEVLEVLGGSRPRGDSAEDDGIQRIGPWGEVADGDHSLTQFATLGLRAAERRGFRITSEVWRRIITGLEKRQHADGGWSYQPTDGVESYGSATCAGIGTLAIALAAMDREPLENQAVQRGLEWLARHFSVSENPGMEDRYLYYYLYSVERIGRLLDIEQIGTHPWFASGAHALLDSQGEDGGWTGIGVEKDSAIATSFALLFLTRATERARPPREGRGYLTIMVHRPPSETTYVILDASGSMLADAGESSRFDVASNAIIDLCRALPVDDKFGLRVFGHRYSALEPEANRDTELVLRVAGNDPGRLEGRLRSIRARGKSPIGLTLQQTARDVRGIKGPVSVILLTNGGALARRGLDPVAEAAAFASMENVRFHVIGFALDDSIAQSRLEEIARAGDGLYWSAAQASALFDGLAAAALGRPDRVEVLDGSGATLASSAIGERLELEAGEYTLRVYYRGVAHERGVWVTPERTTTVVFHPEVVASDGSGEAPTSAPHSCTGCGREMGADERFCGSCGLATQGR